MDVLHPNTRGASAKAHVLSLAAKSGASALVAPTEEGQLRSETSTFWGPAFGSSIWDTPTLTHNGTGLRLSIPLPQLSSEIYSTSNGTSDQASAAISVPPHAPPNPIPASGKREEDDQPFTLKAGYKRKSDAISSSAKTPSREGGEYDITLSTSTSTTSSSSSSSESEPEERVTQRRKHRKTARKEKQKAHEKRIEAEKKVLNGVEEGEIEEGEVEEEEPLDYSKAESVLHPKRKEENREGKGGKKRERPFDPYQKSADAPKGMRRAQTERAGKSATFRN